MMALVCRICSDIVLLHPAGKTGDHPDPVWILDLQLPRTSPRSQHEAALTCQQFRPEGPENQDFSLTVQLNAPFLPLDVVAFGGHVLKAISGHFELFSLKEETHELPQASACTGYTYALHRYKKCVCVCARACVHVRATVRGRAGVRAHAMYVVYMNEIGFGMASHASD